MNFYCITIVRVGDCFRTVQNISEFGDSPITNKKVAMKIYNQQKRHLFPGDYISLHDDVSCIRDYYKK